MKKKLLLFLLIFLMALFTACNGEPEEPEHVCSFDPVKLECGCGKIDDGVVVYIGSSYSKATARFKSLQAAINYVASGKKAVLNNAVVIKGVPNAKITCDELVIQNCDVVLDLDSNEVTFSQDAVINITNANVELNIQTVVGNDVPINVSSGSLDLDASLSCNIELSGGSDLNLKGDNITISSFEADSESEVKLNQDSNVTISDKEEASKLWNNISEEDASKVKVDNHTHNYENNALQCECGKIKDGVVACVGTSYEAATVRFTSVQSAFDYASGKLNTITINIRTDVTENSLTINNSKIKIVLGNKTLTCGLSLTNSTVELVSGTLNVNSFSSASGSTISFNSPAVLKTSSTSVAKTIRGSLSNTSSTEIVIDNHTHNYENTYYQEGNVWYEYQKCKDCDYTTESQTHTHDYTFDSVKQECACGTINPNAVLYRGTSFESAASRFVDLQSAVNYVQNAQKTSGKSSATSITVYGVEDKDVVCGTLSIAECNIVIDLSESKSVTVSSVVIEEGKATIKISDNLSCGINLKKLSDLSIDATGKEISISSFEALSGTKIKLLANKVKFATLDDYNVFKTVVQTGSSENIEITNHTSHTLVTKYNDDKTKEWQECSECGYSTSVVDHNHSYDEDLLECVCGEVKSTAVAYVKDSKGEVSARFESLQAASTYVDAQQTDKNANAITVYGISDKTITCDALSVSGSNVVFDLSSSSISSIAAVSTTNSNVVFKVNGSLSCGLTLSGSSVDFNTGSYTVSSFTSDKDSTVTLKGTGTLTLGSVDIAKGFWDNISISDGALVGVTGHAQHNMVAKYNDAKTQEWQKCSVCDYCTAVTAHTHDFDNEKMECVCDTVSTDVIAYIKDSTSKIIARFASLQDASDYVKKNQTGKASAAITVYGCEDTAITCNSISISDCNIIFDLSENTITSNPDLAINVVLSNAVFKFGSNVSSSITMTNSTLDVASGSIYVNSFGADNGSTICFSTSDTIKTKDAATALNIRKSLSSSSKDNIQVDGNHQHTIVVSYEEDDSHNWWKISECSTCGYKNPKEAHSHDFDNDKLECVCGEVKSTAVAYVKDSKGEVSARFESLQAASNYVDQQQTDKNANAITVYGISDKTITCSSLTVSGSNVVFDLSSSSISSIAALSASSSNVVFKVKNSLSCGLTLSGSSVDFNAGSYTVSSFTSDKDSTVTLKGTGTLTLASVDIAKTFWGNISISDGARVSVTGHTQHNMVTKYNDAKTQEWQKCSVCDYCTAVTAHTHSYDSVTQVCNCGVINSNVVAYIGSSFDLATARFTGLQAASDYVKSVQKTSKQNSSLITVVGCNCAITCSSLSVTDSNICFNLSDSTITSITNVTVKNSKVSYKAKQSLSCKLVLTNSSFECTTGAFTFNDFTSYENSTVSLESAASLALGSTSVAKKFWKSISYAEAALVTVVNHEHVLTTVYSENKTKVCDKCDTCGYSTEPVTHEHSYNNDKLECVCGYIDEDAVAEIKNQNTVTKRFKSLQSAADYVDQQQTNKSANAITVFGIADKTITCSSLSVSGCNVIFDLSNSNISSINTITLGNSIASFSMKTDLSCGIDLNGSSDLTIEAEEITINAFAAETGSEVTLDASDKITLASTNVAKALWNYLSTDSTFNISITGHTSHQYNFVYSQDGSTFCEKCSICDFCTRGSDNHIHTYNSVTKACSCGDIAKGVVAYIGSSYTGATARFFSLQDAADYVKKSQETKTLASTITVKGKDNTDITCSSLTITDSNVVFDLSNSNITSISSVTLNDSIAKLNMKTDLSCGIDLNGSSDLTITAEEITISAFAAESGSEVTLDASDKVTLANANVAKNLWNYLSDESTSNIVVTNHTHTFEDKNDDDWYWQHCTTCDYCTEKRSTTEKWVSVFYLDMANLTALEDIEEIITKVPVPTNVTTYIITGGGKSSYSDSSYYLNPFYKYYGSYYYPNLVQALENGGDTSHTTSFARSKQSDVYQYWKYYRDGNGRGCFIEISHVPQQKLMSDGWVMRDFIDYVYSMENGANTRYLLHLWNHGGGNMWGMMQDMTNSYSWPLMSMKDMYDSVMATDFVKNGLKFDIILFDMCEMQQIETLNMVKDFAKCMVGSENTTYASALGSLYEYMNAYPLASIRDTVKYFIDKTDDKQGNDYNYSDRTWSALDLTDATKINTLNNEFNSFMGAMSSNFNKQKKKTVDSAFSNSVDYSSSRSHDTNSYDIYSVAEKYGYSGKTALKAAIDNVVMYDKHGSGVSGTTGLAFFFDVNIKSNYSSYGVTNYNDYITRAKALYPNLATLTEAYKNYKK